MPDPAIATMQAFVRDKKIDCNGGTSRTHLPKPPKVEFTPGVKYYWDLETSQGDLRVRLLPDVAPMHVSNTLFLTLAGFYDGLEFHRVIPGFMAQGGCPLGTGTGGPGYQFDGEFATSARHDRPGILSMANAGPGTDGSQFFLTFVETAWLDGKHTVFGEVVSGKETLRELEKRGTRNGQPTEPLLLQRATVSAEP